MKTNRIFAVILSALSLAAACNKVETPSGDAAVGFASAEMESGLGSEYIYIPLTTSGETTVYPIKVVVDVDAYSGAFAAVEDVDYMITSKEILVASKDSKPSIEVKIINPEDSDELRFALKIVSQDNAQSISQSSILVKCAKSDVDRICGNWSAVGVNGPDLESYSETWKIFNEGGKPCISGILGESDGYAVCDYEDGKISFELGAVDNALGAYNFTGIGPGYVIPVMGAVESGKVYIKRTGTIVGTVSEDFKTITWDVSDGYNGFVLGVYSYPDGATYYGYYDGPFVLDGNKIVKQPKK